MNYNMLISGLKIILLQSIFQKAKLMSVTSKLTHRQLTNTHNLLSVPFVDYIVDESPR